MGNFLSRAAKGSQAVLFALLMAGSGIVAVLAPATASADIGPPTGESGSRFVVELTGSKDPSKYTVTAKNQNGVSLTFHYSNKTVLPGTNAQFYTDAFPWGGDNSNCIKGDPVAGANAKQFSWTFTATGAGSGQTSVDYCGGSNQDGTNRYVSVSFGVKDGASSTPGTFTGGISYVAADGTTQPFGTNAIITVKTGNSSINLKIGSGGTFTQTGLIPGNYTISGYYNTPQASAHGDAGKAINLKATPFVINAGMTTTGWYVVGANGSVSVSATNPNTPASSGSKAEEALDCHSGAFNWIVCPGIMLLQKAAETLDNFIMNTMNIDVKPIFDEASNKKSASYGYYLAWTSFRILATALLIIAGLIMVASQALGFEFLDAYTIRKTLPRLFVAVIGISLSWPLMRYVVSFFDTLGFDVRELIYHPFHNFSSSISVGGGILSTLAIGASILVLGPASLTILVTILISVFIGFLALVIREIAIIMLIIIAPVAIACYILPNTQRAWNLWRENFLGLLMAFPLISAVIAAGKVFAAVSLTSSADTGAAITQHANSLASHLNGGHAFIQHVASSVNNIGGLTAQAIALFAAYAPYLLIGTIIQKTTGAISTFAGGAGGFLQGISKKMSAVRSNAAAKNIHAMANGNRFKGDSKAAKMFNRTTEGIANVRNAGWNPAKMGSRMQAARSQKILAEAAEYGEKNGAFAAIKGNDDYLMAGIKGRGDDNKVRQYLMATGNYSAESVDEAVAAIRAARRDTNSHVFEAAAIQALPATGTAFKTEVGADGRLTGGGGAGEMMAMINEFAGSDRVMANRMLVAMRGGANGARRFEIAGGGFADQSGQMEAMYRGDTSAEDATKHIARSSMRGQGAGYIAQIKSSAAPAAAAAKLEVLEERNAEALAAKAKAEASGKEEDIATATAATAEVSRELASISAIRSRVGDAPMDNQTAYARLTGATIDIEDLHTHRVVHDTVSGHVDARMDDEFYQQVKNEMQRVETNRVASDEARGYAARGGRGRHSDRDDQHDVDTGAVPGGPTPPGTGTP